MRPELFRLGRSRSCSDNSEVSYVLAARGTARILRYTQMQDSKLHARHQPPQSDRFFYHAKFVCNRRRGDPRSEEHTSELQSRFDLVCRLLLEKKKQLTISMF